MSASSRAVIRATFCGLPSGLNTLRVILLTDRRVSIYRIGTRPRIIVMGTIKRQDILSMEDVHFKRAADVRVFDGSQGRFLVGRLLVIPRVFLIVFDNLRRHVRYKRNAKVEPRVEMGVKAILLFLKDRVDDNVTFRIQEVVLARRADTQYKVIDVWKVGYLYESSRRYIIYRDQFFLYLTSNCYRNTYR